ncbi:entry exclusion protein [Salmonella enterica subsp. enterica serovar Telelkebir]|nr:entry exclusion protein [Salmonella enterica subsp. enterica serovar Telelkebir]ECB6713969.1 entry exclusion protein [Salmonella enterica subsp. enterica serovar Hvittingfoss]
MKKLIFIIPLFLVACDQAHDVDWYKSHQKERKEKIAECNKNADELQKADCKNAKEADRRLFIFGSGNDATRSPSIN